MRILAVVRHPCGGIRTYLKYVYGRLPPSYRITLVTTHGAEVEALREELAGRLWAVAQVPTRRAVWSLTRAVHAHLVGLPCDVVHSHGFTAGVAVALANRWHVPHVLTSHDVLRSEQFAGALGPVKAFALTQLLGQADVIQSVSDDAQANLQSYLPRLSQRCVLTTSLNGIDVDHFASRNGHSDMLRAELGCDPDTLLLGFLGRLMPQKGFDLVIEAVRMLEPRRPFCIVVSSEGAYIREYQQQIKALGLESFFRWRGFAADAAPVIQGLDAVVMPSRWEACGVLAMEALTAGCPLIASRCPGLREVIAGSPAISVSPESAEELADAIAYAMDHRDAVKTRALAYIPAARTRFDAARAAVDLDGLFRRVIHSRQSASSWARMG